MNPSDVHVAAGASLPSHSSLPSRIPLPQVVQPPSRHGAGAGALSPPSPASASGPPELPPDAAPPLPAVLLDGAPAALDRAPPAPGEVEPPSLLGVPATPAPAPSSALPPDPALSTPCTSVASAHAESASTSASPTKTSFFILNARTYFTTTSGGMVPQSTKVNVESTRKCEAMVCRSAWNNSSG